MIVSCRQIDSVQIIACILHGLQASFTSFCGTIYSYQFEKETKMNLSVHTLLKKIFFPFFLFFFILEILLFGTDLLTAGKAFYPYTEMIRLLLFAFSYLSALASILFYTGQTPGSFFRTSSDPISETSLQRSAVSDAGSLPRTAPAWLLLLNGVFLALACNIFLALLPLSAPAIPGSAGSFLPVSILIFGCITPLSEEILFRGILFRELRKQCPFLTGALVSSLLFGFYHGNLLQFLYALPMGFFFCVLTEKDGSIQTAVSLHAVINILILILSGYGLFSFLCTPVWCLSFFCLFLITGFLIRRP